MKELKEIEKAIQKKYRKEIFSKFVKAVKEFNLIEPNDKIAVCISGGKDSFLLAKCMQELKRHNKFNYELKFIVMDPGYTEEKLQQIIDNSNHLNIPIEIFKTNIFDVIKDSDSPCFLCAKMRRGCLYSKAQELGCNKIALGHHFNDTIETILLNMIYNGKFSGMLPILDSDNFENMKLIRPMYYIKEKDIISWTKYTEMSFLDCACVVTKKNVGKRKEIKELSYQLVDMYENADINILNSMFHVNPNTTFIDNLKEK
ncbi:MAG: tRNA 2-thiocytidine(32) synthetase TtcA [Bacilli bacterium]|nr:tRNA 2-thiocytidine(32) synthetase TtcA [Bacilli bacterium]